MADLKKYEAKLCWTAVGVLIHQDRVLFIKHKKLGIWFCPGGHVDDNELPHQAAEREFWEETGVKVKAVDYLYTRQSKLSEYVPLPIESNLHWISKENYDRRIASKNPGRRSLSKLWPLGCEQHLGSMYLVEPVAGVEFKQNVEETDGIAWYGLDELADLETNDDIRHQVKHAMEIVNKHQSKNDK